MKTILIMRHAKSSFKDQNLEDFDRPLSKRGNSDGPRMAHLLIERELFPQIILSSPAKRAHDTAALMTTSFGERAPQGVMEVPALYMGEPSDYINQMAALDDSIERVLVIGHNPGLEAVLQLLTESVQSLPTAAIAHLSVQIDQWKDLTNQPHVELVDLWRPKELKAVEAPVEEKKDKKEKKEKKEKKDKKKK